MQDKNKEDKENHIHDANQVKKLYKEALEQINKLVKSTSNYIDLFHDLDDMLDSTKEKAKQVFGDGFWKYQEPIHDLIEAHTEQAYITAAGKWRNDSQLRKKLFNFFISPYKNPDNPYSGLRARYDLIARLEDEESTEMVFNQVLETYNMGVDEDIDLSAFYGVVYLSNIPKHRSRVLELLRTGFFKVISNTKDDGLVNDRVFICIGRSLAMIGEKATASKIYDALIFASDKKQHYEMNVAASYLTLNLVALDYTGPIDALHIFVKEFEETYRGDSFVMRVQFALWILTNKGEKALEYLQDKSHTKNLELVATALADLDYKNGLKTLQEYLPEIKNEVTYEVFKEAITRLQNQDSKPSNKNRMIWLFGYVSRAEIALGNKSDNVFLHRAKLRSEEVMNYYEVFEIDDSIPEDL